MTKKASPLVVASTTLKSALASTVASIPTTTTTPRGYTILPLSLPLPQPVSTRKGPTTTTYAVHHLYLCPLSAIRDPSLLRRVSRDDVDRCMVVANVPRGADHFRALIATLAGGVAGRFEAVRWEGDEGAEGASESDEEVTRKGRKRKRGEMDLDDERDYGVAAELDLCLGRGRRRVDTPAGRTAVLVLADVKAVQQVLRAADRLARPTTPKEKYPTWDGLEDGSSSRLVENEEDSMFSAPTRTNYQDPTALQALVDSWLQRFNESERAAAERARLARAEPDEDGFVTVSRSSGARVAPVSMRAAEEARRRLAEREQRKREGMPDFYRWQLRERRRKQAEDVRRRFEEDRKMVEVMREERERKRVKGS